MPYTEVSCIICEFSFQLVVSVPAELMGAGFSFHRVGRGRREKVAVILYPMFCRVLGGRFFNFFCAVVAFGGLVRPVDPVSE